ncbi:MULTISPECIES: hypothetical protein [Bradyrhizobium]|uniref:hypothetical protein n=1 Tax=Bradyrhizobium embrapense TaxID=630921 RepID=UPI00067C9D43|nr:hypothetical protein [Bradyrhizobium embrapense]
MTTTKLFAALAVTVCLATPAAAADLSATPRHYRHYHHAHWGLPYHISYLHNYGPGLAAGRFAYYDGPSTNKCYQSSAAYIGQDRRRHPCF